jgi:hypothetical protein
VSGLMITMLLRACRHTMIANAARFAYMVFAMPRLACSRGVPNTAKMATRMPQPVKTSLSLIGLRLVGTAPSPGRGGEEAPVLTSTTA